MKINTIFKLLLVLGIFSISAAVLRAETCSQDCHIIKPYEENLHDSNLLVSKHSEQGFTCVDCHERDAETIKSEEEMYKNGEYDDPILQREYDADFCLRCHEGYETLASRTEHLEKEWGRNPHKSHMGEIDCYECHKVHTKSTLICAGCHVSKWDELLPPGWQPAQ